MTDALSFAKVPHLFDGQPPSWTGSRWPWTFVVTQNANGRFAASAADARSPLPAHVPLGNGFATREAAQAACCTFLAKASNGSGHA